MLEYVSYGNPVVSGLSKALRLVNANAPQALEVAAEALFPAYRALMRARGNANIRVIYTEDDGNIVYESDESYTVVDPSELPDFDQFAGTSEFVVTIPVEHLREHLVALLAEFEDLD